MSYAQPHGKKIKNLEKGGSGAGGGGGGNIFQIWVGGNPKGG